MDLIIKIVKSFRAKFRQFRNRKNVDFCGEGAELRGTLQKRHPNSQILIGRRSRIDGYVVTEIESSKVCIGSNTILGPNSIIDCVESVTIGDNVMISYDCVIADANNHSMSYSKRKNDLELWRQGKADWSDVLREPIIIEDGVFVGARSIILKGVTLGEGAVVGMGSVVTNSVPPYTMVLGNPARAIKLIPPEER